MSRWLVADSLYCPEALFCSHLSSYSHYLREFGEDVSYCEIRGGTPPESYARSAPVDVLFALDQYDRIAAWHARVRIAQVAAICNPMPWDVRKPDGLLAYDLIVSSIPWMVDKAREMGCRAEYLPLAFDTRARVCGMGVERDLDCIFIGTVGPNHKRRTALLEELKDVVTVMPPVFGREYFKTLARANVVFNVHAEWARGAANNMRMFEAAGMGASVVSDGLRVSCPKWPRPWHVMFDGSAREAREWIDVVSRPTEEWDPSQEVLQRHTYESRIPQLVEWARSL